MNSWRKYLLWFAQEHVEFRSAEIHSILTMLKINMKFIENPEPNVPFWLVEFCSESDAKRLTNRSVSLKSCTELWVRAKTIDDLHRQLRCYPENEIDKHFTAETTFKIVVDTYCRHFTQQEKVAKLEQFDYLPVKGAVDLNNPALRLNYFEYYGIDSNNPPLLPHDVFFGRLVACGNRETIKKLSLRTRKFIGNTTMDPQLSLLMANQAQIVDGDLVLDPFVGSGALLVAAAECGGYTFGTDIDFLMLHGKTRPSRKYQGKRESDESVQANMLQYDLQHRYLDVIVNDFSMSIWRDNIQFDSIITDPPYGIREATERIGSSAKQQLPIDKRHLPTHIPSKVDYGIANQYKDLLEFAVGHLKVGGRLVCWFPVFRQDYNESGLPSHPCLRLTCNSEQILTRATSRRLLTYEKIQQPVENGEIANENRITDFREKYYVAREETRKERRMREARIREANRLRAEQSDTS